MDSILPKSENINGYDAKAVFLADGSSSIQDARAGLELYMENQETFAGVQNEWYTPSNISLTGDYLENFEYINGQIVYVGINEVKVIFTATTTVQTEQGFQEEMEVAFGKNGVVDEKSIQSFESLLSSSPQESTCQKVFNLSDGDSLDFFIRQTSSTTANQISILKGVFFVREI